MEKINESTLFTGNGKSIGLTMLDFWKYQIAIFTICKKTLPSLLLVRLWGLISHAIEMDGHYLTYSIGTRG